MKDKHIDLIEKVNGIPMISESFNPQVLITLIAHYRHALFKNDWSLSKYLDPDKIHPLYKLKNEDANFQHPQHADLNSEEHCQIKAAINAILDVVPEWKVYFELPVIFKKINENKDTVSLTNHCIPQVIYLGTKAFKSEEWLQEVIIHEMAHIWLGLLCEMDSFHNIEEAESYTLPSGTKNKDARGVIFAAHFAACVIVFIEMKKSRLILTKNNIERLAYLNDYFSGCIIQLKKMTEVKFIGREIINILDKEVTYG